MSSAKELVFAIVIPAYNEAATIRSVAAEALRRGPLVIVVDDGSSDGTAAALAGLPLVLIQNPSNEGKAASLWRGIEHALAQGAEAVITLDGDGQHDPANVVALVAACRLSPGNIVIGARLADRRNIPTARYFSNRFANFWIAWAAGYPIEDSQSGFRLYPASLLRRIRVSHDRRHGFVFESEILIEASRLGIGSISVPVAAIYPPLARRSHYRPLLDGLRITRMVAWKLLSRGLYLRGLVNSLKGRDVEKIEIDESYKS